MAMTEVMTASTSAIVVQYASSPSESPTPEASSKPAPTTDASLALPDDMTLVAAAPESDLIYFATPEAPSREIWAYSAAEDRVVAVWASMDRSVLSLAHAGARWRWGPPCSACHVILPNFPRIPWRAPARQIGRTGQ